VNRSVFSRGARVRGMRHLSKKASGQDSRHNVPVKYTTTEEIKVTQP
jgi:hypothetical protein